MAIVTLTTDMGLSDFYVAAVKARLISQLPDVQIVDISHDVAKFDIGQAAYLLRNIYNDFPKGSIHIIGVRPAFAAHRPHVLVKMEGHYFISADNGVFSFLFDSNPDEVYELIIKQDTDDLTFPTKNIFTKAAIHLAQGGTPEVIGRPSEIKNRYTRLNPITNPDMIKGHVTHIDSYENVITNISREMFGDIGRGRDFEILFRRTKIKQIHRTYSDVHPGEAVALFGAGGFLELAINQGTRQMGGGAASLMGLKVEDMIRIEYDTKIGQDDVQTRTDTQVQVAVRSAEESNSELRRV